MGQIERFEKFEDFEKEVILAANPDEKVIINFWSTWCKPCIEELPYFEQITTQHPDVKVILVSLDFKNQIEKKLIPFVEKNQLKSTVVALLDGKYNSWIDKVNPEWSGAIPGTLFLNGGKRAFYEKSYHSKEEILKDLNTIH